jgi:hypothetical protein
MIDSPVHAPGCFIIAPAAALNAAKPVGFR